MGWQRRWAMTAILVVSLGASACVGREGDREQLVGTNLGRHLSPGFALTDHRGQQVRLEDLRGRAVALTFVYTSCPDVCPLIASVLRDGYEQLGPAVRERVALVAITVDPERDTPDALQAFSATHRLADNPNWYALTGDRAALAPVWEDYGIEPDGTQHLAEHASGHATAPDTTTTMLAHTDALYFIDPTGRERVLLRSDATPAQIARNLTLLAEQP